MLLLRLSASGTLKSKKGEFQGSGRTYLYVLWKAVLEHSSVSVVPSGPVK